jgi:hypothetical protein
MEPIPYDPETCVTAGVLRAKGCPVTSDIPDHAWIPKDAVEAIPGQANSEDGVPVYSLTFRLHAPFTWQEDPAP